MPAVARRRRLPNNLALADQAFAIRPAGTVPVLDEGDTTLAPERDLGVMLLRPLSEREFTKPTVLAVQHWTGFTGNRDAIIIVRNNLIKGERTLSATPGSRKISGPEYFAWITAQIQPAAVTESAARAALTEHYGFAEDRCPGDCGELLPIAARWCPRCGTSQGRSKSGTVAGSMSGAARRSVIVFPMAARQ